MKERMRESFSTPESQASPPPFQQTISREAAAKDTRDLVARLTLEQAGLDEATIQSVAEATGKSADAVRAELQMLRLEKRIKELEARPIASQNPVFAGKSGGLLTFLHSLTGQGGIAGQLFLVCLGISAIVFFVFLGIAMIH